MMTTPGGNHRVALLDTTVQIDRNKSGHRKARISELLEAYDFTVTTSICLLEFKATLIQECITIHNQLRLKRRFTLVRDALTESRHRQARLRSHIFNNLLLVYASSFRVTEQQDERLAEKARLRLESVIPRLYGWFKGSVDAVLPHRIDCTRAGEAPVKKQVSFGVNLPRCSRTGENANKQCCVEEFIRSHAVPLVDHIRRTSDKSEQLERSLSTIENVLTTPHLDLSHEDCRSMGDCLIALEGEGNATHAISSNSSEWELLSEVIGCEFVRVTYPDERSQ